MRGPNLGERALLIRLEDLIRHGGFAPHDFLTASRARALSRRNLICILPMVSSRLSMVSFFECVRTVLEIIESFQIQFEQSLDGKSIVDWSNFRG